jgi:deoxycytidylate deaminase
MIKTDKCINFVGEKQGDNVSCKICLLKEDCLQDGESYKKIMICHDCSKMMIEVDRFGVIGLDNQMSYIQIFVCWNCKRIRKNMS